MENQTAIVATQPTATASQQIILQERCKRLLELYNPSNIGHVFSSVRKVTDCLALQDKGEPTLSRIARQGETERTQITAVLKLNIIDLDNFLHLKNKLTESEVDFIAEEILRDFGHGLTMADVLLVMKTAKKGGYGKFYERLSAPDIMQWFEEYFNKRLETSEDYNRQRDAEKYGYDDGRYRSKRDIPQEDMRKAGDFLIWKDHYKRTGEI